MFPRPTITLSRGNLFLLLILVGGAIVWTIFCYRKARIRRLLALPVLRALSLALLLFLLFSPILGMVFSASQKPLVALLVDTSESMSLEDIPYGRIGAAKEIASPEGPLGELWEGFDLRLFQFSDRLSPVGDTLVISGERTEIGTALQELEREIGEKPQAALVLTDGGNNSGPDPITVARNLGFPVFPIGIGSSAAKRDGSIERVESNEICYAGDSVPVEVVVRSEGFLGESSELSLRERGAILSSSVVSLTREAREQSLRLAFVPRKPGTHTLKILLSPQPGELSEENNQRSISIEVLRSKIQILSIFAHPSWDLKFLSRSVASDPNLELTSFTHLGRGRWLLQKGEEEEVGPLSSLQAREWDVLLLHDLTGGELAQDFLNRASESLETRGGGMILWGAFPPALVHVSPLIPGRGRVDREFSLEVTEAGLSHPIMRVSEEPLDNRKRWEGFPPLGGCYRMLGAKPGSELLGVHPSEKTAQGPMPVIALQRYGRGKVLQISALSLWRWALLPLSLGKEEFYSRFWANVFRYLTAREDLSRLLVSPAKRVFQAGEEIEFIGHFYDRNYRPLDGAELKVLIEIPGEALSEVPLFGRGEGRYEGSIGSLPAGEYDFRAEARVGGELVRGGERGILVEKYGLELRSVGLNQELLRRIAEESGGSYYLAGEVEDLGKDLKLEKREAGERREIELSSNPLLFLLIVVLLGSEWFIRRRRGFA